MNNFLETSPFQPHMHPYFFDALKLGFCIVNVIWDSPESVADCILLQTNKTFNKEIGQDLVIGASCKRLFAPDESHWLNIFGKIVKTGDAAQLQLHLDGYQHVEAFKVLAEDQTGLVGLLFHHDDGDHLDTSLHILKSQFIIRLNDELKELDPLAVQKKAAEILGTTLKADRVVYKTVVSNENQRSFQVDEVFHTEVAPFQAGLYPFHLFGSMIKDQEDGKTISINLVDESGLHANEKAVFESINVRSFIQVPLIKNGKYVAALAVHQATPRVWTPYEIDLVQETAQRTWGAVEHAKAEASLKLFNIKLEELVQKRTEEIEDAKIKLQENKDLLQSVFNAIPHAMSVFQPIYNEQNQIDDFELVIYNPHVEEVFDPEKKAITYSDFFPISIKYGVLDRFKEVMHNGKAQDFELEFTQERQWFHFKVSTVNQLLIVMREDITERKELENQIIENQSLLQSVFHTSLIGMSVLEAVYNESGQIVDFVIRITNLALDKETGRSDLIGRYYLDEFPGIKPAGLFDMMVKVMETGVSDGKEYFYPFDGFHKWYSCMFVKTDGSLVATNLDITERKEAEQVITQNAAMIKAIAESAPNMLYAIDIQSNRQIYSNANIEQLVNLPQQAISDLAVDFFKQYIHPEDLEKFFNSIKDIEKSVDSKPKTLTYRLIDAFQNTHWIKTTRAVYQRDDQGKATHIVGVSQDITQEITLAQRNQELEVQAEELKKKQQKAILEATLMAQEEERRRISDNLHNGMGQVLYGAKARLDQLNVVGDEDWNTLNQVKELLRSTIAESRKLSHQLMPPMLEDYGLTAAILDICKTLTGNTRFIFNHHGLDDQIDNYVKMMVYRIVQELMINIVNHAKASIAQISLRKEKNQLRISVEDNGIGFSKDDRQSWGLGLQSIEMKIKMLNGIFKIESDRQSNNGTKISIIFTLP